MDQAEQIRRLEFLVSTKHTIQINNKQSEGDISSKQWTRLNKSED